MRAAIYISMILVSTLPFPVILFLLPNISTSLLVSGAAELAFAFYAFASGNGAYSMIPALKHRVVREHVLGKAVEIIRAARTISLGAVLLISTGVIVSVADLSLIQPLVQLIALTILLLVSVSAVFLVTYGAVRLFGSISFVPNKYLETGKLEDYRAEVENR